MKTINQRCQANDYKWSTYNFHKFAHNVKSKQYKYKKTSQLKSSLNLRAKKSLAIYLLCLMVFTHNLSELLNRLHLGVYCTYVCVIIVIVGVLKWILLTFKANEIIVVVLLLRHLQTVAQISTANWEENSTQP